MKQRAAELYVRYGETAAFESAMEAENAEDGLRAAHLTGTLGTQDLDAASKLRATAAELAAREADLKNQKADLDKTLATLAPLNDLLQKKLAVASAAYDKVQALVTADPTKHGVDVATGASECPVKGVVVFTDDFGELRPVARIPGIDMGALTGTPVVAVGPAFMRHDVGGDGGNGVWLTGLDGYSYYYAHFSRYEGDDRLVNAGDVIGYVGMTGNATGTAPALRDPSRQAGRESTGRPVRDAVPALQPERPRGGGELTSSGPPGWRNWLTQSAQNRPPLGACGFESHSGHPIAEEIIREVAGTSTGSTTCRSR